MRNKLSILLSLSLLTALTANAKSANINKTNTNIIGQVSGFVKIRSNLLLGGKSTARVVVDRISADIERELDRGDQLEAWLVDAGVAGGLGVNSVDTNDAAYVNSPSFSGRKTDAGFTVNDENGNPVTLANVPFINIVEAMPYALSLGTLKKNKQGAYVLSYDTRNNLSAFDEIMITIETGGNLGDYDPRPGSQVGSGEL